MDLYNVYVHIHTYKPTQSQNHPHLTALLWNLRWNKALTTSSPKSFHRCGAIGEQGHIPPWLTLPSQPPGAGPLFTLCQPPPVWKDQCRSVAVSVHKGE